MADTTNLGSLFSTTDKATKQTNAQTYMEAYSKNPNTFTPLSMSSDSYISGVSNKMSVAQNFYDAGMSDDDVAKYMYIHDQVQQGNGLSTIQKTLDNPDKAQDIVKNYKDMKAGYDTYLRDQNLFNEMSSETMAKYDIEAHYKNFMNGGDEGIRDMAAKLAGMNGILREGTKLGMSEVIDNNQHDLKGTMFDKSLPQNTGGSGKVASYKNKLDTATLKAKGVSDDDITKMQDDESYFYDVLSNLKKGHEDNREKGFWEKVGDWFKAIGTSVLHGAWDIISSPFQIVNAVQAAITGDRWDDPVSNEMNKWVQTAMKGHSKGEQEAVGIIDGIAEFVPSIALEVMSFGADTPAFVATSASILSKAGMMMPTVSGVQEQALAINKQQGKTGVGDNLAAFGKALASGAIFAAAGKVTGAGFGTMPGIKNLMGAEAGNLFAGRTLAKLGVGTLENTATMYGMGRMNDFLVNVGNENVGNSFLRMVAPVTGGKVDTDKLTQELISSGVSGTLFSAGSLFSGTRNANKLVKNSYEDMVQYSPSVESIKNDFVKQGMSEVVAKDHALQYLQEQGIDVSSHIQKHASKIYGDTLSQGIENSITTSTDILKGYLNIIHKATGDERFDPDNAKLDIGDSMSQMLKFGFPTDDVSQQTEKGFVSNEDFKNHIEIADVDPSKVSIEEVKNKKGKVLRKRPLLQKSASHVKYEKLSEEGKRALDGITGDAKIKKLNYMSESKDNEKLATSMSGDEPITKTLKETNKSFADVEKDFGESNPWTTDQQIKARKEHEEYVSKLKDEIGKAIASGDDKALKSLIDETSLADIHSLYEGKKINAKEYNKLLDIKEVYDSATETMKGSKDTVESIKDVSDNPVGDIDKFEKIIDNDNIDDKFVKENLNGEQKALFSSVGNKVDLFDRIQKLHDNAKLEKQFKKDVKSMGYEKAVAKMNADVKAKEQAPALFTPAEGEEKAFEKERAATVKKEEAFNKVETAKALKEAKRAKLEQEYNKADKKGNGQDFLDYVDKYLKDNEGKTPTFDSYSNQKAISNWFEKVKANKELEAGKDATVFDESEVKLSNSKAAVAARAKSKEDIIANAKVKDMVVMGEIPKEPINEVKSGKELDTKLKATDIKKEVVSEDQEEQQEPKVEQNPFKPEATKKAMEVKALVQDQVEKVSVKKVLPQRVKDIKDTIKKIKKLFKSNASIKRYHDAFIKAKSGSPEAAKAHGELVQAGIEQSIAYEEMKVYMNGLTPEEIAEATDWKITKRRGLLGEGYWNFEKTDEHINYKKGHSGALISQYEKNGESLISVEEYKQKYLDYLNKYKEPYVSKEEKRKLKINDTTYSKMDESKFYEYIDNKPTLPKDQQKIVDIYKSDGPGYIIGRIKSEIINDGIESVINKNEQTGNTLVPDAIAAIEIMNKMKKTIEENGVALKEPIKLYRGISDMGSISYEGLKVGDTVTEDNVTSTTYSEDVTGLFIKHGDINKVKINYEMAKGSKVLPINESTGKFSIEKEVAFHDKSFRVKKLGESFIDGQRVREFTLEEIPTAKIDELREIKQSKADDKKVVEDKSAKEAFAKRAKELREKASKEQKQKIVKMKMNLLDSINAEQDLQSTFKAELEDEGVESVDSVVVKGDTVHALITLGEEANLAVKKVGDEYVANIWGGEDTEPNESDYIELENGKQLYTELQNNLLTPTAQSKIWEIVSEKLDNLEASKKTIGSITIEDVAGNKAIPKNIKDKYFNKIDNWEDALNEIDKVADEEVKNSNDLDFERKVCK